MFVRRLSFCTLIVALVVLGMALLVACSPMAQATRTNRQQAVATGVEMKIQAPAATEAPAFDEAAATPVAEMVSKSAGGSAYPAAGAEHVAPPASSTGGKRMIIKDAVLELLVQDTNRAIDQVTSLASDQGGYLISSRSWYNGDFKLAEIRLGVPSATFENALNYLRRIGLRVISETASGQDVSAEYNDLQLRLTNLEATAARVRSFLDEAKTVEESLNINRTLSELEGEIEQIKGQMRFYEGRAAYSTITVTLMPEIPTPTPTLTPTTTPTPTPGPGWNPGQTAQKANQVMVKMWQGFIDLLIWVLFLFWPFILVGGLIAYWLRRKARRTPPPPQAPPPQE